jgi:hypothetical protein
MEADSGWEIPIDSIMFVAPLKRCQLDLHGKHAARIARRRLLGV